MTLIPVTKPPPTPPPPKGPPPGYVIVDVGALIAQTSAQQLNRAASSAGEQQAMVAGENSIIPIIYGFRRVGAKIIAAVQHNGNLLLGCVWGQGECDAVVSTQLNDAALPAGVTVTSYLGTSTQTPDPSLVAAFAAQSPPRVYADALAGTCYSVFVIPPNVTTGFPRPTAVVRGLKVRNTEFGARGYSENPAYILADFIESTTYGMGRSVDWATVATVAAACDTMVGSPAEQKRLLSLLIDSALPTEAWVNVLREYAGCYAVPEGSRYRLVVDDLGTAGTPKNISAASQANPLQLTVTAHGFTTGQIVQIASVAGMTQLNGQFGVVAVVDANTIRLPAINSTSYTAYSSGGTVTPIAASAQSFDASSIKAGTLKLQKRSSRNLPTVLEVSYTDIMTNPWRDAPVTVYASGVLAGTTPRRMSRIARPGTLRYSEAYRAAVERLNDATLNDLAVTFQTFDAGLQTQVGDIIDVTHPKGITAKLFRVVKIDPVAAGRWAIAGAEWDPGKYSTTVVTGPTVNDTTLASPAAPPVVTGLVVTEEIYQAQSGYWASRLRLTWDNPEATYPFVQSYEVKVLQGTTLQEGPSLVLRGTQAYVSAALPENVLYTVTVGIVTTIGAKGTVGTASITNNGKLAKPSDVPALTGFEVGGEVRLNWTPAVDLDLTGHEIRYSTTGGTWATATLLDRIAAPAVRYQSKIVPAGLWRFWIKGLDSVRTTTYPYGQESMNPATVDIDVTIDANAFVAATYSWVTPTLIKMTAHVDDLGASFWVTDFAQTWNTLFPSTMSGYSNALYTYHTSGTSGLVTETADMGISLTGDWSVAGLAYQALSGSATATLELNNAGGETAVNINGATNATPIVIATTAAHGYVNNDEVVIAGVGGNTAANGRWRISVVDSTHFSLYDLLGANAVAGNGAYTSGGTAQRWVWSAYSTAGAKTTARYARLRLETPTTGTLLVTALGTVSCAVVTRRESSSAPVSTSATTRTIVQLANTYNKYRSIAAGIIGTSAVSWTYDKVEVSGNLGVGSGYCLRFSGGTDYVTVASAAALNLTSAVTLECLIKPATLTGGAQLLISKGEGANNENYALYFYPGNREFEFVISVGGTRYSLFSGQNKVNVVDRWFHVAATYDGTTRYVYLDGVQIASSTAISGNMNTNTDAVNIGGRGKFNVYFNGAMDEVRVWNTARSQAQIDANKFASLGATANLVGDWKFDEGTGTTAYDSSGGAYDGTLTNGPVWRPYDGFDLYAFDAAGAQVVASLTWEFQGV